LYCVPANSSSVTVFTHYRGKMYQYPGIRPCPMQTSVITYIKKGCDSMNEPHYPTLHSWTPGYGQDQFPGIGNTFAGPPAVINPTVLPAQSVTPTAKGGLPFNISNLSDLKAIVDRMGGIEGMLSTMGKFQKFIATMQQFAPMIKLLMGKKGGKAATVNTAKRAPARRRSVDRPNATKARTRRPVKRR
jgi:hypothetical protein